MAHLLERVFGAGRSEPELWFVRFPLLRTHPSGRGTPVYSACRDRPAGLAPAGTARAVGAFGNVLSLAGRSLLRDLHPHKALCGVVNLERGLWPLSGGDLPPPAGQDCQQRLPLFFVFRFIQ